MKKVALALCIALAVTMAFSFALPQGQAEAQQGSTWLIMVSHGPDKPYNQYTALIVAFLAKRLGKVDQVMVFYDAEGVRMAKKGALAGLALDATARKLIAGQIEGLSPGDLPVNLELFARFLKDNMGVSFFACGTCAVMDGIAKDLDDTTNLVDFVGLAKLPDVAQCLMAADKIIDF